MLARLILVVLFGLFAVAFSSNPCIPRKIPGADVNIVCVCNSTYCDQIDPIGDLKAGQVAVYLTNKQGKRFERGILTFAQRKTRKENDNFLIRIDPSTRYQSIVGFGGAFTDAVGINLNKLGNKTRRSLIQQYYGDDGIGYTLGRVPIASCDFSTRKYSYADQVNDFELKSFTLAPEDYNAKIPFLIEAFNLTKGQLKLFASPWSPPAWFKTSGRMEGPGTLKGPVNGPYYQSYAKYFIRFFEEYAKNGVLFWGLTTQNEPTTGLIPFYPWQTMWLDAYEQQQFIKNYLGPYLRRNRVTSKVKLMVNDDNLIAVPAYTNAILDDNVAAEFIDGIGVHWYESDIFSRDRLNEHHQKHPDKFILSTEACNGYETFNHGPRLGSWARGDRYARDIIGVLQRWTVGWTDWNLCLDENGGPNWAKNFVDSPIITNASADEFYKQPMFYVLGHFSKFIAPGSVRVNSTITPQRIDSGLDAVAFTTPSNQRVIVVLNSHDSNTYDLTIEDPKEGSAAIDYQIPPASIASFVWNKSG